MMRNSSTALCGYGMVLMLSMVFATAAGAAAELPPGKLADKPLFRDTVYDGAADPALCWNRDEQKWFMFYTNRRANVPNLPGVSWVHGTPLGIAESSDGGATWTYRGQANINYGDGEFSYWAPEVVYHNGLYHMFLTFVPGMHNDWSGTRDILHLTSTNLLDWTYRSTLKLASHRVIDACVYLMPDGTWRLWYNNEPDRKAIYYAESPDLFTWQDKGKVIGDQPGEGPKVFQWKGRYWMVVDVWRGLGVYHSEDGAQWTRQKENLLETPGKGLDDQVKGGHPDVVVSGDRAYLFYFTHPGRRGSDADKDRHEQRRSSIQVVELQYKDGRLDCDRDTPTYMHLVPPTDPSPKTAAASAWPEPTNEQRPWTRWWWLGSAVDEANLTAQLTQLRQGGLGGVEICPIYGVKGYEDRNVDFLSPRWMELLSHTTKEGKRLGLGVDLTTGTGWPFGGAGVTDDTTSAGVVLNRYELEYGGTLDERLPDVPMAYVLAASSEGVRIDVTGHVKDRRLEWAAPEGKWRIYAVGVKGRVQRVKRPAPGGEGFVVDPYSVKALDQYLGVFDKAFADFDGPMPRGHFHDSFEYYGATWTRDFFEAFKTHRGYDLRDHIEALFGDGDKEVAARVKADYRRTISELHIAYIERWTQWCHRYGSVSRNQAHGAPANLIDLYAAADIPDTEIFRTVDQRQIPMLKFSSSAAHLAGKTKTASESFTWLGEHFQTTLAEVKAATDLLFLSGVNYIFFHGIPYSPQEAAWPGWQFYASVNMGPSGGLWKDLPAYNAYVARCQSILQSGSPDNDVLLYYPMEDLWHTDEGMLMTLTVHNQEKWLWTSAFYQAAMTFWEKGYLTDYTSDRLLAKAEAADGVVTVAGSRYRVVVVPPCRVMPLETLEKLAALARQGATVLFVDSLPQDVPGLHEIGTRRAAFRKLLQEMAVSEQPGDTVRQRKLGNGRILVGDVVGLLEAVTLPRESVADFGVRTVRRTHDAGYYYFLAHLGEMPLDGWVALGRNARSAVLLDPMFEEHFGAAAVRQNAEGRTEVYLQMQPGQTLVLRTFTDAAAEGPRWDYSQVAGTPRPLTGTWKVTFVEGGPELPDAYETDALTCWTTREDAKAKRFAGTARYTLEFEAPAGDEDWQLDLGRVCESAKVLLNGKPLGTLFCPPYAVSVGSAMKPGRNVLVVEATNLAANRIRDMDQRKVNWKYFHDINVVNVGYKPFDASDWPLRESGLIGPVRLVPLKKLDPARQTDSKPTVFFIGDSTVRNVTSPGLSGWGEPLAGLFYADKINAVNCALGGRSSRTFITEGLWDKVLGELKAGDFVLMQFGHNDGGSLYQGRARASLKGIGEDTEDVVLEATGKPETVHTYGWYLRRYIRDAKAKGATPIVLSLVPRNIWNEDKTTVVRAADSYGRWAKEAALAEGALYLDLNDIVARHYEAVGEETVRTVYFAQDHTHTTPAGAAVTARLLAEAVRTLEGCPLGSYLKASSDQGVPASR